MDIPYVDLIAQHAPLREELLEAAGKVLDHGWFILGPEVGELECELAGRVGVSDVIGVNSGTDALLLALRLAGVGPGDEVITVSHSFVATATAIEMVGATPVFVDIDDTSMLMDPTKLEAVRTARTKAVIPVHLGGFSCDMTSIAAFCAEHGLAVIEDCAQALGAKHKGRSVGSYGIGCFSLHPLKVLSACGDAGFLSVDDRDQGALLRRMRNIGLRDRDHVAMISGNTRLDTLQAALLLVKMKYLDGWIAARRAHAAAYREAFADLPLQLMAEEGEDFPVYSTFVIRHPERDALQAALVARGVDAKIHYPLAIHQQEAFTHRPASLPVTERVVQEILSLPVTPELSEEGRGRVIEAVRSAVAEVNG